MSPDRQDVYVAPVDGSVGVLSAMAGQRLIRRVQAGVYLAADRWDDPDSRATALAAVLGRSLAASAVIGGAASVWWHLLLADCPVVDALLPARAAGGSAPRPDGVLVRGATVPAEQVIDAGPVRVCTLGRAAADVARWSDRPGTPPGASRHALTLLVRVLAAGCPPEEISGPLTSASAGTPAARRLLAEAVAATSVAT